MRDVICLCDEFILLCLHDLCCHHVCVMAAVCRCDKFFLSCLRDWCCHDVCVTSLFFRVFVTHVVMLLRLAFPFSAIFI